MFRERIWHRLHLHVDLYIYNLFRVHDFLLRIKQLNYVDDKSKSNNRLRITVSGRLTLFEQRTSRALFNAVTFLTVFATNVQIHPEALVT